MVTTLSTWMRSVQLAVKEQIDLGGGTPRRPSPEAAPPREKSGKGIHFVGHVPPPVSFRPPQGHKSPLQRSGTAGKGRCQRLQVASLEGRGIGGGVAQLGKGYHRPCRYGAGLTVPQAGEYVHLIVERQGGNGRGHLSCPEVNGHIPDKNSAPPAFPPAKRAREDFSGAPPCPWDKNRARQSCRPLFIVVPFVAWRPPLNMRPPPSKGGSRKNVS